MYIVCSTCKKHKALWEFTRSKNRTFGVASQCKKCRAIYSFENKESISKYGKRYRHENEDRERLRRKLKYIKYRERERAYAKKHYKENIEHYRNERLLNKEKYIKYRKKHYKENKERYAAWNNEWSKNNPDAVKKCKRRWKKKNRHMVNEQTARRRAMKRNQTPLITNKNEIYMLYRLCELMNRQLYSKYHVDHIIPLVKGGLHHQDNLQILSASKNLKKQAKVNFKYRGVTIKDINLCMEIVHNLSGD